MSYSHEVLCPVCAAQIFEDEPVAVCNSCQAIMHVECANVIGGKCCSFGCSGKLTIQPGKIHIIVSGSNAEDVEFVARSLLAQTQVSSKSLSGKWDTWITGGFYLGVVITTGALFLAMAKFIPLITLPIVIIGSLLSLSLIGAFQLRQDSSLSEKNFLSLMFLVFKRIKVFRKRKK